MENRVTTFKGKPISKLNRTELIEALNYAYTMYEKERVKNG